MARVTATGWTVTQAIATPDGTWRLRVVAADGTTHVVEAMADGADVWTAVDGEIHVVRGEREGPRRKTRGTGAPALEAPMPATVTRVVAEVGRRVAAGDVLVLLEAMKMELAIRAPQDGVVTRIACEPGSLVQPGVPLVELE